MSEDGGEVRFECLRCGQVSRIELQGARPHCERCGSGTGVLGDIGQGTAKERADRRSGARASPGEDFNFECLRCGAITEVAQSETTRPACSHCGSKSGVIVGSA